MRCLSMVQRLLIIPCIIVCLCKLQALIKELIGGCILALRHPF